MIYQVSGDILLTQASVIVHGIAANDPMSQGLALSLHQKYPSMHKRLSSLVPSKPSKSWNCLDVGRTKQRPCY